MTYRRKREKINISLLCSCDFWREWSSILQQWTQWDYTDVNTQNTDLENGRKAGGDGSTHTLFYCGMRQQSRQLFSLCCWVSGQHHRNRIVVSLSAEPLLSLDGKVSFLIPVCLVCLGVDSSHWNSIQFFFLPILAPKQREFKSSFTGVYWDISAHKTLSFVRMYHKLEEKQRKI